MSRISQLFKRFSLKVTLLMILSMIFILMLSNLLIYKFSLDSQFNGLRNDLMLIAQIAALDINPARLMAIPLNREGIHSSEYRIIAERLNRIKAVNSQIRYIYAMTKTDTAGIWQFVVDPEPVVEGKDGRLLTSYPGDQYNAARFPEMLKAFEGPSADTKLGEDEWGVFLSGYAPIRDKNGKPVAILGVDIAADDVYRMQQKVHWRTIFVLCLGVVISISVGLAVSKQITTPVERLVEGTRQIAQGNLQYQVHVHAEDEISELAASFNQMAKRLHESRKRILGYLFNVVRTLVRILELRDHYTRGHSEAVAIYAGRIAEKMGFPKETIKLFKRMTLLHDIGKLGIKDSILHKKGSLSEEEWVIIKKHPIIGEEILKPVLANDEMLSVVRGHHERYDGKGYPDQLSRDKINIFASIVSVADAYHAMTSNRSYRPALNREEAIEELKRNSGTQFNPKIVEIFLQILKEEASKPS